MTKEQQLAKVIDEASKLLTTSEVVNQLRLKYTDAYIREIVQYCIKGNKLAILEIVR